VKAQIDDLVIWSSDSNWKLGIGIVYAIHGDRPYVLPINSDGTFGSKQEVGANHLIIGRLDSSPCERLVQAFDMWHEYIGDADEV
jgi:hypothetical protein